ncbi:hypothetical protein SESBI_10762 [Sesbania bispinosa]|nr:hypothetical protein SESBI_10762 [Sesbania bispinosa]
MANREECNKHNTASGERVQNPKSVAYFVQFPDEEEIEMIPSSGKPPGIPPIVENQLISSISRALNLKRPRNQLGKEDQDSSSLELGEQATIKKSRLLEWHSSMEGTLPLMANLLSTKYVSGDNMAEEAGLTIPPPHQ